MLDVYLHRNLVGYLIQDDSGLMLFAGILPEEGNRKLIAKNLGISAQNDFAMLEQIGGEDGYETRWGISF